MENFLDLSIKEKKEENLLSRYPREIFGEKVGERKLFIFTFFISSNNKSQTSFKGKFKYEKQLNENQGNKYRFLKKNALTTIQHVF